MIKKTKCAKCAESIVFLKTKNNKIMPVNWDSLDEQERNFIEKTSNEVEFEYGRHISHFATCSHSKLFRSKK